MDEDGIELAEGGVFAGFHVQGAGKCDCAAGGDAAEVVQGGGREGVVHFPFFGGLAESKFVLGVGAVEREVRLAGGHDGAGVGGSAGGPVGGEGAEAGDPFVAGRGVVGLEAEGEAVGHFDVEEAVFDGVVGWRLGVGAGPAAFFGDGFAGVAEGGFDDQFNGLDFAEVDEAVGSDGVDDVAVAFRVGGGVAILHGFAGG